MPLRVIAVVGLLCSFTSFLSAQEGLRGEYFYNQNLTGTRVTRIDPTIDFDWGQGSPIAGIAADTFSVRWTGEIIPRYSEIYTFYATSDDGVRLWVNGQRIVNGWSARLRTTDVGTIALKAGNSYVIQLEFFDATVDAICSLAWASASQPYGIVPSSQLRATPLGVNRQPNTPFLLAPYPAGLTVDAADFVMKAEAFSDPDTGQSHACTEWEIWMNDPYELVWAATCSPGRNLLGVRLRDGTFLNSHEGRSALMPEKDYTLRVRFRDTSGVLESEWSHWTERTFNTARPVQTLIAQGSVWRVRDTLLGPASSWKDINYDDGVWGSGNAQFGFGDGDEVTFTCCASGSRPVTTYFRKLVTITNAPLVAALTGRLLRDDGAMVYLNGTEVFRNNLPAGTITHGTLASQSASEPDEYYNFYSFAANPRLLREGTNCIAVEVHQSSTTSGDLSFDFELYAEFGTAAPPIRVQREGTNCVHLSWDDADAVVLESAVSPRGPWSILWNGAYSPYVICDPLANAQFYRLRRR
jgi:hypothetical protein